MFQYLGTFFYCYRFLLRIYAILFTIEMSLRFVAVGPRSLCRGGRIHVTITWVGVFEPLWSTKGWAIRQTPHRNWVNYAEQVGPNLRFTFCEKRFYCCFYVTGNILECQDSTLCQLRYQIGCQTIRQIECHVYIECQKWWTLNGRKSCTSWHG